MRLFKQAKLPANKPARINLVHHLSSTGGTVISRCLAAMPDVVLLSEIHPSVAFRVPFYPVDPLGQFLLNYPDLQPSEAELNAALRGRLTLVLDQCVKNGRTLVVRDHSHSDYLTNRIPKGRLVEALAFSCELVRAVTVRHPIDAWLSMAASGFAEHLSGFDDYCRRVLRFLDDHAGIATWRYEDFVAAPNEVLSQMCDHFDVRFDPTFTNRFNDITLTGDSGRRPAEITRLERRAVPKGLLEAARLLPEFREIARRLAYEA